MAFQSLFKRVVSSPQAASALLGGAAVASGLTVLYASSDAIHPPKYPWPHHGFYTAFDVAALRRGFEVYRQVCSTCHSMKFIHYRELVGVTHTEKQAKALARTIEVTDGPNDAGDMFQRPGKLQDELPAPYANENAGRAANNGAFPPDLSLIVKARHDNEDYIFALLTGYKEPPHGMQLRSGLYYNPYFAGGAIAMTRPLHTEGQVEYEDGTVGTPSQMAKDVTTFLCWTSEPELDYRKREATKLAFALVAMIALLGYQKRFTWAIYKTKKLYYPTKY